MGNLYRIFILLSIFFSIILASHILPVSATKWIELEPQEIVDSAEVIVMGQYDFSSKPISSNFIFQGFPFHITKVYRGEVFTPLIVGIDEYDVGWVKRFQNADGEFILFLEKNDEATFLVPVGGPNGMIQFSNGEIQESKDENKTFFEDFLKKQIEIPIITKIEPPKQDLSGTSITKIIVIVCLSISIVLIVFFISFRYKK
ncbi:hypothetical protein KDN24_18405 [Bacillus sp. Bva_UNVM-123]|uniref:hypothetical protein n=1 Tax=Bacillus sp. Bva_UNVM-123 TaxID=2829798 RepID=UPI00391F8CCE